jgi:cytidine deaminase
MDSELFEAARAVRERAHAPYSHFPVGAALRTASGTIHAGCNVENAAFPEGWCAETSAIAGMIVASTADGDRRIAEVLVVAEPIDGHLTTPCGGCRQRLAEFGAAATLVHLVDPTGARSKTYRLGDLLPAGFAMDEA